MSCCASVSQPLFLTSGIYFMHNQARFIAIEAMRRKYSHIAFDSYVVDSVESMSLFNQTVTWTRFVVEKECHIVVSISASTAPTMLSVAALYPNVTFVVTTDAAVRRTPLPNVATFFGRIDQPFYLSGMAAAAVAGPKGCIGFVSSQQFSSSRLSVNAFALGVQAIYPNVPVHVITLGAWGWEDGEAKAAELLHTKKGCKVLAYRANTRTTALYADAQKDVYSCGYSSDVRSFVGDSVLVSALTNFDVMYTNLLDEYVNDNVTYGFRYYTMAQGGASLSGINEVVPGWAVARIVQETEKMTSLGWDVFCRTLTDNRNVTRFQGPGCPTDPFLMDNTTYWVKGIVSHPTIRLPNSCPLGSIARYVSEPNISIVCDLCPPNYHSSIAGTPCEPCEEGAWSPEGSSQCWVVEGPNYGLIIGIIAAGVVLIGVPVAWKLTANHRHVNKLLSNENMATDLAESIAEMNFDQISYIYDVQNPTRVQSAFIKIIENLKHLRKFIPANVLTTDSDDDDNLEDEHGHIVEQEQQPAHITLGEIPTLAGSGCSSLPKNSGKETLSASGHSSDAVTFVGKKKHQQLDHMLTAIKVVILAIRLFPRTILSSNADHYLEIHSESLETLMEVAKRHRGVPVQYFADSIVLSYNAVKRCGAKGYHALSTAKDLFSALDPTVCGCVAGASTGYAWCGYVGSQAMRAFAVYGSCWDEALLLKQLYKDDHRKQQGHSNADSHVCHATGSLYSECMGDFVFVAKDIVFFSRSVDDNNPNGSVLIFSIRINRTAAAAKSGNTVNADEEWMYVMENDDARHELNEAMFSLVQLSGSGGTGKAESFVAKYKDSEMKSEVTMCDIATRALQKFKGDQVLQSYYQ
eukprot:PhF_6_TR24833/c0_g1_i2/m.34247